MRIATRSTAARRPTVDDPPCILRGDVNECDPSVSEVSAVGDGAVVGMHLDVSAVDEFRYGRVREKLAERRGGLVVRRRDGGLVLVRGWVDSAWSVASDCGRWRLSDITTLDDERGEIDERVLVGES